jgi:hypothetical protein
MWKAYSKVIAKKAAQEIHVGVIAPHKKNRRKPLRRMAAFCVDIKGDRRSNGCFLAEKFSPLGGPV